MRATADSTTGDTANTVANAQASCEAASASLAEAAANRQNQELLTRRTVDLAAQGILSAQDRDTAVQTLKASVAHEGAARDQMAAAEAAVKAAQARTNQAKAAVENVASSQGQWVSAQAQAVAAAARLGYTRITAPITGKVGIWAAREGEVINPGTAIVTIVDLDQTWVYAPLPETEAGAVQLGDHLTVRMPGGERVDGTVLAKSAEGDFATQRDVSRLKRDIKTIKLKLLIANPGERFVPGMTAEVLVPRNRLVHA
jgi:multidrug resistance efflux pump